MTSAVRVRPGAAWSDMDAWALPPELGWSLARRRMPHGLSDRAIAWRIIPAAGSACMTASTPPPGPLGWLTRASGVLGLPPGRPGRPKRRLCAQLLVDPGSLIWAVVPESRRCWPVRGPIRRARHALRGAAMAAENHSRGYPLDWPRRERRRHRRLAGAQPPAPDHNGRPAAHELSGRASTRSGALISGHDPGHSGRRREHARAAFRPRSASSSRAAARRGADCRWPSSIPTWALLAPTAPTGCACSSSWTGCGITRAPPCPDRRKSNVAAALGWVSVRFGWTETVDRPCATATELAELFWARGWRGAPRACSPGCPVGKLVRDARPDRTCGDSTDPLG